MTARGRALVVGGTGFFGGLLVDDLIEHTELEITTASRGRSRRPRPPARVTHAVVDLHDRKALREVAAGHDLIFHTAGPFEKMPFEPLDVAIELGIDYVDISESRGFRRGVVDRSHRIKDAGIRVLNGFSVVPQMTTLFTHLMAHNFDRLVGVRTFAGPDTRRHRGKATFGRMLYGAGRPFRYLEDGAWVDATGWSKPEWVQFPAPIGTVLSYLVYGMSDLDVLPAAFGVRSVEFRAGCEHALLNRMLSVAARIRRRIPFPLERFGPFVRGVSWLGGRVGRHGGAAIFEITGTKDGRSLTHRVAVVSTEEGEDIPVAMAGIAAEAWERDAWPAAGIVDAIGWMEGDWFIRRLEARGIRVVYPSL